MLKTDKNSGSKIYHSIINEDIDEFTRLMELEDALVVIDLADHAFRAVDLRKFSFGKFRVNFDGCYFRNTDLRGLDFSRCTMNGASIHDARISGCLFPDSVDANEIQASNIRGIRMRCKEY